MNQTYGSERINGGRRCYLSVSDAHIQLHTGVLSSWAQVHSQQETSLDLQAYCTQRGGPAPITAVPITRHNVTWWLCQVPCDWPRAYLVPQSPLVSTVNNKHPTVLFTKSICSIK